MKHETHLVTHLMYMNLVWVEYAPWRSLSCAGEHQILLSPATLTNIIRDYGAVYNS